MGFLSKIGKGLKKAFKSAFKRIKKITKPIGRALKKGLGKVGKFFGKLGPLGTLALSLMLPGLGTLFSQFGAWASTLSGPLGAVMNGIATAGNAIGRVYSSVTGMISDTIGTIAGNTIGKIPVGAGKNLTDVYKGFTTWVGNTMDNIRMKVGLPTKNVTPTTAVKDASKLGEQVADLPDIKASSYQGPTIGQGGDIVNIQMKEPSLLSSTDGTIPTVSAPEFSLEISKPSTMLKESTQSFTDLPSDQVTKVITGFEKTPIKVGQVELESLTPTYKEIATDALTAEQIAMNERLTNYTNYLDNYNKNIQDAATIPFKTESGKVDYKINPDFSQKDLLVSQGQDLADFGQKAFTAQSIIAGEPQQPQQQVNYGGVPYSQLELQTDITTTNDYAKAYGQQYTAQGYQGPMTVEGFASAGYYGGDPFSFGQYLNSRPIVGPQPNIVI
jgi:hypothetical protein